MDDGVAATHALLYQPSVPIAEPRPHRSPTLTSPSEPSPNAYLILIDDSRHEFSPGMIKQEIGPETESHFAREESSGNLLPD